MEKPLAISYVTSTGRLVTHYSYDQNLIDRILKSQVKRTNVYLNGQEFQHVPCKSK